MDAEAVDCSAASAFASVSLTVGQSFFSRYISKNAGVTYFRGLAQSRMHRLNSFFFLICHFFFLCLFLRFFLWCKDIKMAIANRVLLPIASFLTTFWQKHIHSSIMNKYKVISVNISLSEDASDYQLPSCSRVLIAISCMSTCYALRNRFLFHAELLGQCCR